MERWREGIYSMGGEEREEGYEKGRHVGKRWKDGGKVFTGREGEKGRREI